MTKLKKIVKSDELTALYKGCRITVCGDYSGLDFESHARPCVNMAISLINFADFSERIYEVIIEEEGRDHSVMGSVVWKRWLCPSEDMRKAANDFVSDEGYSRAVNFFEGLYEQEFDGKQLYELRDGVTEY